MRTSLLHDQLPLTLMTYSLPLFRRRPTPQSALRQSSIGETVARYGVLTVALAIAFIAVFVVLSSFGFGQGNPTQTVGLLSSTTEAAQFGSLFQHNLTIFGLLALICFLGAYARGQQAESGGAHRRRQYAVAIVGLALVLGNTAWQMAEGLRATRYVLADTSLWHVLLALPHGLPEFSAFMLPVPLLWTRTILSRRQLALAAALIVMGGGRAALR